MAETGKKDNGWKELGRKIIYSVNPFDYEQKDKFAVAARFWTNPDDFSDEQISDMIDRVHREDVSKEINWKEGDYKKGRTPPPRVAERMDMLRLSVGDPQKYNTIEESVFRPTRGAEEGEKFYTYKDKGMVKELFNMVKKHIPKMEKKKGKSFNVSPHSEDIRKGDARFKSSMKHVGLERYQVSVGEDDIGKYMAIYDPWDIDYNVPVLSSVARKAIPGFEFYDRVYYETTPPKADFKLRGTEPKLAEAEYVSPKQQRIEDIVMNWMKRVF